jgi:CDP-diacylglycerol--glycerol-3-phosphate 3-phosphatidyltransferase
MLRAVTDEAPRRPVNTANVITIARVVLMPIPGWMLYSTGGDAHLLATLGVLLALGLTDWVDGIIARREGPTVLGGLLDPIADKIFVAAIYLPLTERGLVPLWMTVAIFSRDFLVTALRTSLSLRGAPMRTSTLAKFKTAIQMLGIGYVILYAGAPRAWFTLPLICAPIAFPLGLILYRLATGKEQGRRSLWMAGLFGAAVGGYLAFGPAVAGVATLWLITGMTVISGFSYLVDAWAALRGRPGSLRELLRFALDGLLVPVALLLLLGRFDTPGASTALILAVVLELASGGLANFLASLKIAPRFRWIAIKSLLQVGLCAGALAIHLRGGPSWQWLGSALVFAVLGVTVGFAALAFGRHRQRYLSQI